MRPGARKRLDLYPYHKISILPHLADIEEDQAFAVLMNPSRILNGNWKGIEIKRLDGTTESLEYGEQFPAGFGPFYVSGGWFPANLGDHFLDDFLVFYHSRLYRFDFGGHFVTPVLKISGILSYCNAFQCYFWCQE